MHVIVSVTRTHVKLVLLVLRTKHKISWLFVCFMLGEPFINMTAENMTVNEGQTRLNVSVNVHSYPKEPKLTWYKDGRPFTVRSNDRYLARLL